MSLLKNYVGDPSQVSLDLPPVSSEGTLVLEPRCIIESRGIKVGNKFVEESLVHWKCLPTEEATWERMELLNEQFPTVDLGDKDLLDRAGIDGP